MNNENHDKAVNEAEEILEQLEKERNLLKEKYKDEPGIDGHNKEYKTLTIKAFEKIEEIKKKYNIS